MATADLITELNSDLNAAYAEVGTRGGVVPEHKNSNNLATAISTIPSGGTPTPEPEDDPYIVPEFDGGQYDAIAYVRADGTIGYYAAPTQDAFTPLHIGEQLALVTSSGEVIPRSTIVAYSFGAQNSDVSLSHAFFSNWYNLRRVYGLETRSWTSIDSSVFTGCVAFNQPIVLPPNLEHIYGNLLANASNFNQPITFPEGLVDISGSVLQNAYRFDQPITFPSSLTYLGSNFLYNCHAFNSPIVFQSETVELDSNFLQACGALNAPIIFPPLTGINASNFMNRCGAFNQPFDTTFHLYNGASKFMSECYSFDQAISIEFKANSVPLGFMSGCTLFNHPITLPDGILTINNDFLYNCASFNQPIQLPAGLRTIGVNFLARAENFAQPLTIPDGIRSVQAGFLYDAASFTGPLNVGSTTYTGVPAASEESLASSRSDLPLYTTGVAITGADAARWLERLPNMDEEGGYRRKLILG